MKISVYRKSLKSQIKDIDYLGKNDPPKELD